ncbi:hypothetical protein [Cryobacterium sp. CG_9.6]|uniref:hypothetical protein n=1 Tax=Cryobacterium sp. CG_9.6 TaxID=2760710 RepID=UPI002476B88D|nr:hypothetical protein [Cryobacterium sp. CG_9.6]MDH6235637.1 hypothetical protein [Cryobacterium sp. CG_9.6]
MTRIDIVYDNRPYSLADGSLESLQLEIDTALTSGVPYWLQVNSGEGRYEDAYLLIAPGIPIVVASTRENGVGTQLESEESFIPDGL